MSEAFIYRAALFCPACAAELRESLLPPPWINPENPDESAYDSDDWPKGPFTEGGGPADSPQHCDHCGIHLENPLTPDGLAYVAQALAEGTGCPQTLAIWAAFYDICPACGETGNFHDCAFCGNSPESLPLWAVYDSHKPGADPVLVRAGGPSGAIVAHNRATWGEGLPDSDRYTARRAEGAGLYRLAVTVRAVMRADSPETARELAEELAADLASMAADFGAYETESAGAEYIGPEN